MKNVTLFFAVVFVLTLVSCHKEQYKGSEISNNKVKRLQEDSETFQHKQSQEIITANQKNKKKRAKSYEKYREEKKKTKVTIKKKPVYVDRKKYTIPF